MITAACGLESIKAEDENDRREKLIEAKGEAAFTDAESKQIDERDISLKPQKKQRCC